MQPLIKTVFHIHTDFSDDSNCSTADLIAVARAQGVGCLAVTDHDSIDGARHVASSAGDDVDVIIGEEVSTRDGHLIGLFLTEFVKPGQPVRETAEAIRAQGGLVIVPHPFNRLFGCSLRGKVNEILDLIDAVEIVNSQNLLSSPNRRAAAFAHAHDFPAIVGTDTHHRGYLDSAYQWIPPFDGPASFLTALRSAHFVGRPHPISYFARTASLVLRDKLGLQLPEGYAQNCGRQGPRLEPVPARIRSMQAD